MSEKKTGFEEVEILLQDIGGKIEELIEKGKEASGEAKVEIDKKINDLKEKKTTLEKEFRKGKAKVEKAYHEKKDEMEPNLSSAKFHFINAFKQLKEAIRILLKRK